MEAAQARVGLQQRRAVAVASASLWFAVVLVGAAGVAASDSGHGQEAVQIGALDGLCRVVGARVRYVKPHGALYHATVHHEAQAWAVVEALGRRGRYTAMVGDGVNDVPAMKAARWLNVGRKNGRGRKKTFANAGTPSAENTNRLSTNTT